MIKVGYALYATRVYQDVYKKQAKSPSHFVRLCLAEEKQKGYEPARRFWHLYEPTFIWSEKQHAWLNTDGSVYGPKLPWERTYPPSPADLPCTRIASIPCVTPQSRTSA